MTAMLLGSLFVPVGLMLLMLGMQAVEVRLEQAASRAPAEVGTVVDLTAAEPPAPPPPLPAQREHRAPRGGIAAGARHA